MYTDKDKFISEVSTIVENNSFDGCSLNQAEIDADSLYVEIVKDVLKSVFKYGYGMDTHLNILNLLHELGIEESEYSNWNK